MMKTIDKSTYFRFHGASYICPFDYLAIVCTYLEIIDNRNICRQFSGACFVENWYYDQ